ncbi:CAP domain-containing protein [Bacillus sp. FSL K6-3431]|uniref:CAP domain-containing protein n=1 Tax=Bacillus sp. FSL K6-3431 TaxID=2921500 RepID=UPI0030F9A441
MKKMIFTTAAAVAIMAAPFAGKADAAQVEPIKAKVVFQYNTVNLSDHEDLLNQICKKYNIKWNMKDLNLAQPKPTPEKQEKPVAQPKPTPEKQEKPVAQPKPTPEKQEKPVTQPKPTPVQPEKPVAQPKPTPEKQEKPAEQTTSQLSAFEQQVFDLTNQERTKNGLAPLKIDLELSKVAREKSRDMSANNYFDHNSPTYGSPFDMMKKFGITYRSAGENIAMGQRTPQEVVTGWMNSSGHRANILSQDFTHIGVGHDANGNYWTQQFIGK